MYDTLSYLSFDNVEDFKRTMALFPTGNVESNRQYLLDYKNGNKEARDMLICTNLRLVFKIAQNLSSRTKSFELLDCLNEGVIGFMEGIERFDINRDGFSKYITSYISGYIKRAIELNDCTIRKSADLINKSTKFKKIILEHEKRGLPIPDDDKMCEMMGITKKRLKTIKNDYLYDTISTNTKVNEDDQSSSE